MADNPKGKGRAQWLRSSGEPYSMASYSNGKILDRMKDKKHMERVAVLKSDHKLGHGHANALVAHHRAVNGET